MGFDFLATIVHLFHTMKYVHMFCSNFNITKLNIIVGRPKMAFVVFKCGEKPKKVMHISFGIRSEF